MRIVTFIIFFTLLGCVTGKIKDGLASMEIHWEVVSNLEKEGCHARFTFINKSDSELKGGNWTLYFNQANVMPQKKENPLGEVSHINGDWFKFTPTSDKFLLKPNDTLQFDYHYEDALIKNTDVPLGPYFVVNEDQADEEVFEAENFAIKAFSRPEQIHRSAKDFVPIPESETLYAENENITELNSDEFSPIIPSPYHFERLEGSLQLNRSVGLWVDKEFGNEEHYLQKVLQDRFEISTEFKKKTEADIRLVLSKLQNDTGSDEGYELSIDSNGISIMAQTKAGAFYAIQSLLALQIESSESGDGISFPYVKIQDHPRFGYRGFQLDVGRNFQTTETIKKTIDILAFYKINTFLFYFTEDEGWRLEIEGLPELTEVGGQRQHASMNEAALHPSYGSGPFANKEGSHGTGFYSKDEFIEILKYANERHIKVIPEVNLPGHARAAIKSMEKRYEKYMDLGDEQEANRYRLIDPDDKSVYSSAQSFKDNVACVCRESVYRFYEKVIDVIIDYYEEAGVPLEYFHVGGDEVPNGPWTASPICDKLFEKTEGLKAENLHTYFFKRTVDILKERDLTIAGWEETALKKENDQIVVNKEFSGGSVVPYVWNNLWGAQDLGYKLANAGYPVVLCPVTNFYFDLAYDKHPEEPGLYWAGFVNTRNAYEYAPFNVFHTTVRNDSYYTPIDQGSAFKDMERLTEEGAKNILGIQAQLWSETLKGPLMLEYYMFPKLLGFAESAWAKEREWESIDDNALRNKKINAGWNQMANSIGKIEMNRLNSLFGGFKYRIPPPGAKIQNGILFANSAYPGLEIRYTTDGTEPGPNSPLYSEPLKINEIPVKLRAFNNEGRGSRTSEPKNTNLNLAQ